MTDAIYDRLRSIGVSVETADALAPVVAGLSPRKREAFFLWAMNYTEQEIADELNVSQPYINQLKQYFKCLLIKSL
jgi:DNA-directed RNA polymerase specialized sigma24 family protein